MHNSRGALLLRSLTFAALCGRTRPYQGRERERAERSSRVAGGSDAA
jgi:hypothetical protein